MGFFSGLFGGGGGGSEVANLYATVSAETSSFEEGLDRSSRQLRDFSRDAQYAGGGVSGFFRDMTAAASGFLAAGLFQQIGASLKGLWDQSLAATGQYQAMEVGMIGLLAREIAQGDLVTSSAQVRRSLTEAERNRIADLTAQQERLNHEIHITTLRTQDWTDRTSEATKQDTLYHLQERQNELAVIGAEIAAITAREGQMVTVSEQYYANQRSIAEVYPEAEKAAGRLMDEISRIAIYSPYQLATVQNTFRTAMAFGYASDEAMDFTQALLNVAAGVGADNNTLGRMAYNLAQVRMVGKVTAMDIRQLAMAGFDLNSVLRFTGDRLGVNVRTHEDFNKALESGKITWQEFTESFAAYAETNFGGASERMSTTLMGLQSTFQDVFMLTMPKIMGPAVEAASELLSRILDVIMTLKDTGKLEEWGEALGRTFTDLVAPIDRVVSRLEATLRVQELIKELAKDPEKDPELLAAFQEEQELTGGRGLGGALILGLFGEDQGKNLFRYLDWFGEHMDSILTGLKYMAMGFAAISAMNWASGVVALLGQLANPIFLLITGVSVLATAWTKNWFGIRDATKPITDQIGQWLGTVRWHIDRFVEASQDAGPLSIEAWEVVGNAIGNQELATAIRERLTGIVGTLEAFWAGVKAWWSILLPIALEEGQQAWADLVAALTPLLTQTLPGLLEDARGAFQGAYDQLRPAFEEAWPATVEAFTAAWETLSTTLEPIIAGVVGMVQDAGPLLGEALTTWQTVFGDFWAWAGPWLLEVAGFVLEQGGKIATWVSENMPLIEGAWSKLLTNATASLAAFREDWEEVWPIIQGVLEGAWETIRIAVDTAITTALGLMEAWLLFVNGDYAAGWETLKTTVEGYVAGFGEALEAFANTVLGIFGTDVDSVWAVVCGAWDRLVESADAALLGIENAIEAFKTWMQESAESIVQAITKPFNDAADAVRDAWNFITGKRQEADAEAQAAQESADQAAMGRIAENPPPNPLDGATPGVTSIPPVARDYDPGGWHAQGLDAVFRRPTLIGVGEAGAERVTVTPIGKGQEAAPVVVYATVAADIDIEVLAYRIAEIQRRRDRR
jgi:tape measure domain-containing protein